MNGTELKALMVVLYTVAVLGVNWSADADGVVGEFFWLAVSNVALVGLGAVLHVYFQRRAVSAAGR